MKEISVHIFTPMDRIIREGTCLMIREPESPLRLAINGGIRNENILHHSPSLEIVALDRQIAELKSSKGVTE